MKLRARHAWWLLGAASSMAANGTEIDGATGLVKADGWEEVRLHCGGCHSLDLVVSQRSSRNGWRAVIQTMQRSHGMAATTRETEARIAGYLAKHYAPEAHRPRRAPIPPALMPDRRPTS